MKHIVVLRCYLILGAHWSLKAMNETNKQKGTHLLKMGTVKVGVDATFQLLQKSKKEFKSKREVITTSKFEI